MGFTPGTATAGDIVVGGTLAIANGGTGQTTANNAFNALAPSQTSNSGKYLTTNGTTTSWGTVDALPSQTGNSGKYLTTNGTAASWGAVTSSQWTTTGSDIYYTTGNVGIGITSLTSQFTVAKSSNGGGSSSFPSMLLTNTLATQGDNATTYNFARFDIKSGNGTVFGDVGTRYDTGYSGMYLGTESNHPMYLQTNGTERMRIDTSGNVTPGANGTQNLGSTSLRWANVYTSDLHLNNGIGNYTIVEGEEDLFLYNNKSGKTYKFALIEVDPSTAPAKMKE